MAKNYSIKIVSDIEMIMKRIGWNYHFDEGKGAIFFGVSMGGKMNLKYVLDINHSFCIVYVMSPINADSTDENMMADMAKFLCMVNYGLKNGNFEIDMKSGEIRYKCCMDWKYTEELEEMFKVSLYEPAAMFERYGKGIIQIVFNNMPAEQAIGLCEENA